MSLSSKASSMSQSPPLRSGKVNGINTSKLSPVLGAGRTPAPQQTSTMEREGSQKETDRDGWRVLPQQTVLKGTMKCLSDIKPWGELNVEYHIENEGRKSDFIGLYNEDGRACGTVRPPPLLTKRSA